MDIIHAKSKDMHIVKDITLKTIQAIYPHYYPKGAVDFFILHHNDKSIMEDIQLEYVYLIYDEAKNAVGTITLQENKINRLFVLPQFQHNGFGRKLMDFAEAEISKDYKTCHLDASLPAKSLYLKRGYFIIESLTIETDSGDFLCYDVMKKDL